MDGVTRNISSQLLRKLSKWLKQARANRVDEPIDDEDWETLESHSFCGTGYAIVTTYENLRRNADVYTRHDFSYVLLDEAQKIKNPDAVSLVNCHCWTDCFHQCSPLTRVSLFSNRTSRLYASAYVLLIGWQ